MTKIMKTLALLIVFYVVPLLGNIGLLLNLRMLLLMVASIIMMHTQPEMKVSEAKEKKASDRNSIFIILLAGAFAQVAAIIEWAYFNNNPTEITNTIVVTIGIGMLVGGLAFRIWAIRTLAEFFTSTVQVKEGHRVIQNGPYRVVRHPSYLGALVAIVGSALVIEAPVAALLAFCAMIAAYAFRINVEETALISELGYEYRRFQRIRRYKVVPLVW